MPRHPDVAARFWSHVVCGPETSDCWLWSGAIADDGYGRFWVTESGRQRVVRPHRFALELATGERLREHEQVLHRCDVPLCVRGEANGATSHLSVGDNAANMLDRSHAAATLLRAHRCSPATPRDEIGLGARARSALCSSNTDGTPNDCRQQSAAPPKR